MKLKIPLLALSTILFILFILCSFLVAKEFFLQIDFDATVKIQDNISHRFDYLFSIFSLAGSAEVTGLIWLSVCAYLLLKRLWLSFLAMSLFPIALFIEVLGKLFIYHPSPPYLFYRGLIQFSFPSHYIHTGYSYPSGHMMRTAFLVSFLIVYLILRGLTIIKAGVIIFALGIAFIMAVSRVYLGEHWLSDVLGGILLGSSTGILAALFVPLKNKKA